MSQKVPCFLKVWQKYVDINGLRWGKKTKGIEILSFRENKGESKSARSTLFTLYLK